MKVQVTQMSQVRILVVEDEPLIRMFMVDSLEDAGFLAEEAGTAGEAMSKIEHQDPPFAAGIIDVGLPDRPGDALAGELRVKWRDLPIIIASGHDEHELARQFSQDHFMGVL